MRYSHVTYFIFLIFVFVSILEIDQFGYKELEPNLFSFIKIKAVYHGNLHTQIDVIETDIPEIPRVPIQKSENSDESEFITRGMVMTLIEETSNNCRISDAHPTINSYLAITFKIKKQVCMRRYFEAKYNDRNCSTLGKIAYALRGCKGLMERIVQLETSISKLKDESEQLDTYILSCLLVAIRNSWLDGRKNKFTVNEDIAKECSYDDLYSMFERFNLLNKMYIIFRSFTRSSSGKKIARRVSLCCLGNSRIANKCEKSAFNKLLHISKKFEIQAKIAESEMNQCASYLAYNDLLTTQQIPSSSNQFSSLTSLIESLAD
ncbi:hypothetical protein OIY81_594 [Cryptosporidium canis]|nr:hypothetical protein OIY81_594 [Cryptosporidium canis]